MLKCGYGTSQKISVFLPQVREFPNLHVRDLGFFRIHGEVSFLFSFFLSYPIDSSLWTKSSGQGATASFKHISNELHLLHVSGTTFKLLFFSQSCSFLRAANFDKFL